MHLSLKTSLLKGRSSDFPFVIKHPFPSGHNRYVASVATECFLFVGSNDDPALKLDLFLHFVEGHDFPGNGVGIGSQSDANLNADFLLRNVEVDLDVPFVEKYDFLAAVSAQQLDRNKGIFDCCNRVVIRECIYSKLT